jgi:hypothetical protein
LNNVVAAFGQIKLRKPFAFVKKVLRAVSRLGYAVFDSVFRLGLYRLNVLTIHVPRSMKEAAGARPARLPAKACGAPTL